MTVLPCQDYDVQLDIPGDGNRCGEISGCLQTAPLQKCKDHIYNIYIPWRLLQQQNYFSRFKTNHSALLPTLYPAWWRQHWWTFQGYKLSSVKLFLGQNLIKMMEILVNDWKLKYTLQFARWRNLWVFLQLFHIGWCSLVQSPLHHFIIIQSGKCTSSKLLHFLLSWL